MKAKTQFAFKRTGITLSMLLLVLVGLIACEQVNHGTVSTTAIPSVTPTIVPPANPTDVIYMMRISGFTSASLEALRIQAPAKYLAILVDAKDYEQRATMVAQNPYPTELPGWPPTSTPRPPRPTPPFGIQPTCYTDRYFTYELVNCWRGPYNGSPLTVATAVKRWRSEGKGDGSVQPDQWLVLVYPEEVIRESVQPQVYNVPAEMGSVRIGTVNVNGTLFTLIQTDFYNQPLPNGSSIVFDLATHQFIVPTPTP